MKRFLSVMIIALLVLGGAFAGTSNMAPSATKPGTEVKSTVDVGLDVELSAMTSYAFGFSNTVGSETDLGSSDLTKLPTPFSGTLALNYDAARGIGTTEAVGGNAKDIWMYCKIQAKDAVTLEINAGQMTDQNGAPAIDMTVTATQGYTFGSGNKTESFTATSSPSTNGTITITPSAQAIELNAISYKLKVETSKLPVLSQAAKYTGTITVNVAGA